jgi:IS5 family transposase
MLPCAASRACLALGPEVLKRIHERMVRIAQDHGVTAGRRMRVDTTVVETNIHHPTDSTLLGDGVRVLTRIMKKIGNIAGAAGTSLRDRTRSVSYGCWRSDGSHDPKARFVRTG